MRKTLVLFFMICIFLSPIESQEENKIQEERFTGFWYVKSHFDFPITSLNAIEKSGDKYLLISVARGNGEKQINGSRGIGELVDEYMMIVEWDNQPKTYIYYGSEERGFEHLEEFPVENPNNLDIIWQYFRVSELKEEDMYRLLTFD